MPSIPNWESWRQGTSHDSKLRQPPTVCDSAQSLSRQRTLLCRLPPRAVTIAWSVPIGHPASALALKRMPSAGLQDHHLCVAQKPTDLGMFSCVVIVGGIEFDGAAEVG